MIRLAVVGLGKMGLSHLAMIRPHPDVELVGVCDSAGYLLDVLNKYTGMPTFTDYDRMLAEVDLDAVIIATPTSLHAPMVRKALLHGVHVFCEKPLFLGAADGEELTALAEEQGLVTQVGYHNKFVGSFSLVQDLIDSGALGKVSNVLAEAYGPVVLKPAGRTWRSSRSSGGGCLYDYAAHPLDLVTWYFGMPDAVGGSRMTTIFSAETDDAVTSTLYYPDGLTAQLSCNWSDESQRKMTTKISIWGSGGHIYADRQEIRVFLRGTAPIPSGFEKGWTVKYTTELTEAPWFYLRGEEYSAQLDTFVERVTARKMEGLNTFASATVTDRVISMIVEDARRGPATSALTPAIDLPAAAPSGTTPWGARAASRWGRASSVTRRAATHLIERVRRGRTT